jgi:hypothetical protein
MARPTVMTPEMMDLICTQIAGGKSLRSICADEDMPAISTVMLAVVQDRDGFRNIYAHAREAAGYSHGDGVIEVVELLRSGTVEPQTAKVMMDGLKWAAERMAPKAHNSKPGEETPSSAADRVIEVIRATKPVNETDAH